MALYFHETRPNRAAIVIRICGGAGASIANSADVNIASSSCSRAAIGTSAWQSLAMGDGQIEFELVGTAPRWIGPCGVLDLGTVGAEIEFAFPCRLDAR